jgi:hypothetical protein
MPACRHALSALSLRSAAQPSQTTVLDRLRTI